MPDQKLHTSLWYTILGSPLDYYWEYSLDLSWQYLIIFEAFLSIHYPCSLPLNAQLQIVHQSVGLLPSPVELESFVPYVSAIIHSNSFSFLIV